MNPDIQDVLRLLQLSKYSKTPFKIRPKKWYDWINPFWWKQAKTIEKLMIFAWRENNMDHKLSKYLQDMVLYGQGVIEHPFEESK